MWDLQTTLDFWDKIKVSSWKMRAKACHSGLDLDFSCFKDKERKLGLVTRRSPVAWLKLGGVG